RSAGHGPACRARPPLLPGPVARRDGRGARGPTRDRPFAAASGDPGDARGARRRRATSARGRDAGMTTNRPRPDSLDLLIPAWLDGDARGPARDDLLGGVLERTSHMDPLPAWRIPERWIPLQLALRLTPRVRFTPVLAIVALTILALVTALLIAGSQRHL